MRKIQKIHWVFGIFMILSALLFPLQMVQAEVELKADNEPSVITAFETFDVNENALHLAKENKPTFDQLMEVLPENLEVYLNDSSFAESIEVDWFCVGEDYEESESFYFQFSPIWDENRYILSEDIDLLTEAPYIAVFFYVQEDGLSTAAVTNNSYEPFIFNYLTDTLGYNTAAACGAMANIYSESAFIPINLENIYEKSLGFTDASYTMAVDNGSYANFVRDSAGYGLCQWTFWSRKQGLYDLAKKKGVSIGDAGMQLDFLNKELMAGATGKYMKAAPNTEQGCYDVGYYFCQNFERPAQVADEKSIARGNLAKNYYWEEYATSIDYNLSISGHNRPGTMKSGTDFKMTGTIKSGARIRNLTVGVYDESGKMIIGKNFAPNVKSYDLSTLNSSVVFKNLKPGFYYYRVSASNAVNKKDFLDHFFIVLASDKTIANGTYMLVPRCNRSMVVSVEKHSNSSTAKMYQEVNTNSSYQYFVVTYAGDGYYTLQNKGSGLYLDVPDGKVVSGGRVQQYTKAGTARQNWQIIPVGDSYVLVPQTNTSYCMSVEAGATTAGARVLTTGNQLKKAQRFQIIKGGVTSVFRDVNNGDWYTDYVKFVYEKGLMSGNDGLFEPNQSVSKAMVAQVLYNMEGKPAVSDKSVFQKLKDVYEKEWYGNAVAWAYAKGIITGDLNTKKFSPEADVTREQLALMYYRYAVAKSYSTKETSDLKGLKNAENVSNWALDAMKWAVGSKLISGIELKDSGGKVYALDLAPQKTATRAQMAAILMRFYEKYK